jgi:hypothetical protein
MDYDQDKVDEMVLALLWRIRLSNAPCCSAGFNGALDS